LGKLTSRVENSEIKPFLLSMRKMLRTDTSGLFILVLRFLGSSSEWDSEHCFPGVLRDESRCSFCLQEFIVYEEMGT
jgi:hypothetical protein